MAAAVRGVGKGCSIAACCVHGIPGQHLVVVVVVARLHGWCGGEHRGSCVLRRERHLGACDPSAPHSCVPSFLAYCQTPGGCLNSQKKGGLVDSPP